LDSLNNYTIAQTMGIKDLNRFIRTECSTALVPSSTLYNMPIQSVSFSDLSEKTVVIDISIYMYKYSESLIENIYLMISIFRHYNIVPIFIFDGKSPQDKRDVLLKRRADKRTAENEYNELKEQLANMTLDDDKQEIVLEMEQLKKQFINITKSHIAQVKELITAYGCTYYDAPGEADELCSYLVLHEIAWACMSEDMDMFVYGCPRVLRYFSIMNHTAVLYNTEAILRKLGITQKEFREICILSGTDYTPFNVESNVAFSQRNKEKPNLYKILKLFKKYHKQKNENAEFYEWIMNNYVDVISNYDQIKRVYNMFDLLQNNTGLKVIEFNTINKPILKPELRSILEKDGFVFA